MAKGSKLHAHRERRAVNGVLERVWILERPAIYCTVSTGNFISTISVRGQHGKDPVTRLWCLVGLRRESEQCGTSRFLTSDQTTRKNLSSGITLRGKRTMYRSIP